MNKILISFFSVILPKIMKFLNNHAEEMLDDILNKFYKNFKDIVNNGSPKEPKLEDKSLNEQEIIKKYLEEQEETKEREIVYKYFKKQAILKEKQDKIKIKIKEFTNNPDIDNFNKRWEELKNNVDYLLKE